MQRIGLEGEGHNGIRNRWERAGTAPHLEEQKSPPILTGKLAGTSAPRLGGARSIHLSYGDVWVLPTQFINGCAVVVVLSL